MEEALGHRAGAAVVVLAQVEVEHTLKAVDVLYLVDVPGQLAVPVHVSIDERPSPGSGPTVETTLCFPERVGTKTHVASETLSPPQCYLHATHRLHDFFMLFRHFCLLDNPGTRLWSCITSLLSIISRSCQGIDRKYLN
jgi:hypothetical protein